MQDLAIFSIGSERNRWLATRASVIAGNVANADTPGYKARDVASFEAALGSAQVRMGRTQAGHMVPEAADGRSYDVVVRSSAVAKHSGNGVSLETEMANLGEARSQQSMVTGILGAFHRMLLSSCKG